MKTHLKCAFSALLVIGSLVMGGCGKKLPYVDVDRQKVDMETCEIVESFKFPDETPVVGKGYTIGCIEEYRLIGSVRKDLVVKQVLKDHGIIVQVGSGSIRFFVETDETYVDNMALQEGVYVFVGTATLHTREGDPAELMAFTKMKDKYLKVHYEKHKQEYERRWLEARKAEDARRAKEAHKVRLAQARKTLLTGAVAIPERTFKMMKTEVTQDQWESVMGDNPSHFKGGDRPVENVSWYDVQKFIEKLNNSSDVKAKVEFRLPTEEEWEYCCRAGGKGDWGKCANGQEGPIDAMGWCCYNGYNGVNETHPVAQKEPNAWGLYDMHGNVYEWTSTAVGGDRVIRGGCWMMPSGACRAGLQSRSGPDEHGPYLGFRLVSEDLWTVLSKSLR